MIKSKIAIIIPTYNSEKYLDQCLLSVLNQDSDSKIYINDNGSTDKTLKIIEKYNTNSRIQIKINEKENFSNFKKRFKYVFQEEEFITLIHSDDWVEINYISNIINFLTKNENIECFQSDMKLYNNNVYNGMTQFRYNDLNDFKVKFCKVNIVNCPTVVFKKSIFQHLEPKAHISNNIISIGIDDYDMWGNLAENKIFIHPSSQYFGYNYRLHSASHSQRIKNDSQIYIDMIQKYYKSIWKI